jgi:hypothetical protein
LIARRVIATFNIDCISGTCPRTEFATDALLESIWVAIELMATMETWLGRSFYIRILNGEVLLKHSLEGDPEAKRLLSKWRRSRLFNLNERDVIDIFRCP